MNPEMSKIKIDDVVYTNQLGRAQGCFNDKAGFSALNNIIAQSIKIANKRICHNFPGSTYSQPWFPSQYQYFVRPIGPMYIPIIDPATKRATIQKSIFTY